jgi:hypothetical protein
MRYIFFVEISDGSHVGVHTGKRKFRSLTSHWGEKFGLLNKSCLNARDFLSDLLATPAIMKGSRYTSIERKVILL